jgi:hypothetical protein
MMKKRKVDSQTNFLDYDEQGTQQVSEQIMDSYSSGAIDESQSEQSSAEESNQI